MKKDVRLADIAERLGVSTVTVSNALANQKGVSSELREKIKQTAAEMGYQPKGSTSQVSGEILNLGVIISEKYLGDYPSFYWKLYQELTVSAREQNCVLLFEMLTREAEQGKRLPLFIHNAKVAGILVIGEIGSAYLQALYKETSLFQVYIDFMKKGLPVSNVMADNYYGMYRMVNYLLDKGHRDIAYVGTLEAGSSTMDRYFGYCRALTAAGVPLRPEWVLKDRDLDASAIDIQLPETMPTAFACSSDLTASELVRRLKDRGIRVPEDVSVAGFNNYLCEGLCDIPITTYEVNRKEMVRTALRLLIGQIQAGGQKCFPETVIVSGYLVEKESVQKRETGAESA